jgi:hypothetical protein
MADVQFGRCISPISPPNSALIGLEENPIFLAVGLVATPSLRTPSPNITSSSTSEDEAVEAKRQKLDPDYAPSTASEGTLTATQSQEVSECEEEKEEEEEDDTETEEESWKPSRSTSPEQYSSPSDD